MAIYGIGIMLIGILSIEYSASVNVMAYADDFSVTRNVQDLRRWRSVLTEIGMEFGFYPNPTKACLVINPCASEKFESVFFGTKIKITTERCRYLRWLVGTRKFKDLYFTTKVNE